MATFPLKVMTIDHCFFEGDVDRIVVRTSQGDVGILPNHVPYIAALGIGALTIIQNGEKRIAAIAGGFVDVTKEGTTILARTCEWADEIDVNRANSAAERARAAIQKKESEREYEVAQVTLYLFFRGAGIEPIIQFTFFAFYMSGDGTAATE